MVAWISGRLHKKDPVNNQKIFAWSAFQEIFTKVLPNQVNLGYLPSITDLPIEMKNLHCNLQVFRHEWIRYKIHIFESQSGNLHIDVILDAMFKIEEEGFEILKKKLTHIWVASILVWMLRTIYEQFNKCDIIELLSATGLGGKSTIKRNFKAGDVKEGIMLHKKLLDSLLRHKVAYMKINV